MYKLGKDRKEIIMEKLNILIASGGTIEKIDDVRVMTNISSGKLGAQIANKFLIHGHDVNYVHSKNAIMPNKQYDTNCFSWKVSNADSVMKIMEILVREADAVIMPMAVSDFTFEYEGAIKCGSNSAEDFIEHMRKTIKPTPKIISHFRAWNPNAFMVGFKFTSGKTIEEVQKIAKDLLIANKLDAVFANDKEQMKNAGLHCGYLITKDSYVFCEGKYEIVDAIYETVIKEG